MLQKPAGPTAATPRALGGTGLGSGSVVSMVSGTRFCDSRPKKIGESRRGEVRSVTCRRTYGIGAGEWVSGGVKMRLENWRGEARMRASKVSAWVTDTVTPAA